MPITNLKNFYQDLDAFIEDVLPEDLSSLQKALCYLILRGVVFLTPVDTGRARGNWQVTINYIPTAETGIKDKGGDEVFAAGGQVIESIPAFCVVFITNNVPYIEVLDQGLFDPADPGPSKDPREDRLGEVLVKGGYSVQAEEGIISVMWKKLEEAFPLAG